MKKVISLCLALLLCVGMFSAPSQAANEFEISAGGVLTNYGGAGGTVVIPDGVTEIGDYAFRNCTTLTGLLLPNSLTAIGEYAFAGCSALAEVKIPDSVTSIGPYAFSDCTSLLEITIPGSISYVHYGTFSGCTSLVSAVLLKGVNIIELYAFENCTSLTSVIVPQSVVYIDDKAFLGCTALGQVSVPKEESPSWEWEYELADGEVTIMGFNGVSSDSVTVPSTLDGFPVTGIGSSVFAGRNIKHIELPQGVTHIAAGAFNGCSALEHITIPESVTFIGDGAFAFCSSLTDITIPGSVSIVSSNAFWGCTSLASVVLKDGVRSIEAYAFQDCTSLISVTVAHSVKSIDPSAFGGCIALAEIPIPYTPEKYQDSEWEYQIENNQATVTAYNGSGGDITFPSVLGGCSVTGIGDRNCIFPDRGSIRSIAIPEGVISIGDQAFYECFNLTEVALPNSVKTIGENAFCSCSGLESLALPQSLVSIESSAFAYCSSLRAVAFPQGAEHLETIGDYAFMACESLGELMIPGSVKTIGAYAFTNCTSLKRIAIPSGVSAIGDSAFSGCTSLVNAAIPSGVKSIGSYAFSECVSLKSITIPGSVASVSNGMLKDCTGLNTALLQPGVARIEAFAFQDCTSLTQVMLAESVTYIDDDAFSGCTALVDVSVPKATDTEWQYDVVDGQATITWYNGPGGEVTIPDTIDGYPVTRIGDWSFYDCSTLIRVTIPDSVTCIDDSAFYKCISLNSVTIPGSVTEIKDEAFADCESLEYVEIPGSVAQIGNCAFQGCSTLAGVSLQEGIKSIGDWCFYSCSSLTDISLPASLTHIGAGAFRGCLELSVIIPEAENPAIPFSSENRDGNNYTKGTCPMYSYIYSDGDYLVRLELICYDRLLVETYTTDFHLRSSRIISGDLATDFGGFFAGKQAYFIITGRQNPAKEDNVAVVTVTKYDKDWNYMGQASLYGANTTVPFISGSVRCAEYEGMLYVHTCHEMYNGHQANLTFCLRESDMTVTDARYRGLNISYGYVSHSFNQYIMIDEAGRIVTLDHGDAYPRSAVLQRYPTEAGAGELVTNAQNAPADNVEIEVFPGAIGDNTTGASLGGLAETSSGYITAYNYNGVGANSTGEVHRVATADPEPVRDVYMSWTGKSNFSEAGTRVTKLMDYPGGGTLSAGTPVLVPLGPDGGWILWAEYEVEALIYSDGDKGYTYAPTGTLRYARYAADGGVGEIKSAAGALSDCQPIVVNGKAIWYVTDGSAPIFYTLDDSGLTAAPAAYRNPDGIQIKVGNDYVYWTDVEPFIDANSRTMVPLRAVAEALGLQVSWDGASREASFTDGVKTIIFPIGSSAARTGDGATVQMDTAAVIVNDRTFAPIRYLAEYFGHAVGWDGAARTVIIS